MKILVTAATTLELAPIAAHFEGNARYPDCEVVFHKTGIGMLATAFNLLKLIPSLQPDIVIQAGIAGCFHTSHSPGQVVAVSNDRVADMGVEENGVFKDVFEMGLEQPDEQPFQKGSLPNPWLQHWNLDIQAVNAVTVNEISTALPRIGHLSKKYHAVVESMEGAALHYVCLQTETPFIQLRAISNYVGERDKRNWIIQPALKSLAVSVHAFVGKAIKHTPITAFNS